MSKRRLSSSTPEGPSQRQLRAGELVRHALVEVLSREDLGAPELKGVSITVGEVRASPDLKHATVFVSALGQREAGMVASALNKRSKFMRGRLAARIDMKFTPDLRFLPDASYEEAIRINALLARPDVARDLGVRPDDDLED